MYLDSIKPKKQGIDPCIPLVVKITPLSSSFPILGLTLAGLLGHQAKFFVGIENAWNLVHNYAGVFSRGPNFSSIWRWNLEILWALPQGSFLSLCCFGLVSSFGSFWIPKENYSFDPILLPNLVKSLYCWSTPHPWLSLGPLGFFVVPQFCDSYFTRVT